MNPTRSCLVGRAGPLDFEFLPQYLLSYGSGVQVSRVYSMKISRLGRSEIVGPLLLQFYFNENALKGPRGAISLTVGLVRRLPRDQASCRVRRGRSTGRLR